MGYYIQSKELLETALEFYIKLFKKDNIHTAWVLTHLGNTYNSLENYSRAQEV